MSALRKFRSDANGNIAIIFALAAPFVVGAAGAAITYSSGNAMKGLYQGGADAAVLAGAALATTVGSSERQKTTEDVFKSNIAAAAYMEASTALISVTVAPGNSVRVDATVTGGMKNPFAGVIGKDIIPITVQAAAVKDTTSICVLGLNGFDKGSFDINGNPTFNAECAVQANSSSSSGMTQEGKVLVQAKKFSVNGQGKVNNYFPPPTESAPKVADPYASVPFPAYDDCSKGQGKKGMDIKTDTTLEPGTYCGGIHVSSTAKVTLKPGIYVMADGPFWVNGSGVVTGSEVTIAFTGSQATLNVWGDSTVNLTSPTSGTYANFQFFQDRTSASNAQLWASIGGSNGGGETGNTKLSFDGTAYFPTQNFWVFGNANVNANSPGVAIVADKIWTQGNATFKVTNQNPRNLNVKAPPSVDTIVRLVK